MTETTQYTHRLLARVLIEAKSPIAVYTGEKQIHTDAVVCTDVNGLPYIPGTSIAGVVRHALQAKEQYRQLTDAFFGYQRGDKGQGSEIIFSEARMIGKDGKVVDGLSQIDVDDAFYGAYFNMPVRQHVRISDKGVAEDAGKFDQQIVYKGTRFVFSIEVVAKEAECELFDGLLEVIRQNTFRLGSGSRKGYGDVEVIAMDTEKLDLTKPEQLESYLATSSALSVPSASAGPAGANGGYIAYELTLAPEDFTMFGSGYGDAETDAVSVREKVVTWNNGKPVFVSDAVLIPASSLKGALSHRTAFYYNKLSGRFAGYAEAKKADENLAVRQLFGYADKTEQKPGKVLFTDIIEVGEKVEDHIFNHVSIDRFTGGAIDGALFSEKALYLRGRQYKTTIYVKQESDDQERYGEHVVEAFEQALKDVCAGMLPLGGAVNKGYGSFCGKLVRDNDVLFSNI